MELGDFENALSSVDKILTLMITYNDGKTSSDPKLLLNKTEDIEDINTILRGIINTLLDADLSIDGKVVSLYGLDKLTKDIDTILRLTKSWNDGRNTNDKLYLLGTQTDIDNINTILRKINKRMVSEF